MNMIPIRMKRLALLEHHTMEDKLNNNQIDAKYKPDLIPFGLGTGITE